jgi:hypothetical protein
VTTNLWALGTTVDLPYEEAKGAAAKVPEAAADPLGRGAPLARGAHQRAPGRVWDCS